MMRARDFRRMARYALRGKWKLAVWVGFLASLLGGGVASYGSGGSVSSSAVEAVSEELSYLPESSLHVLTVLFLIFAVVILVYSLMLLVIGGASALGYARFNLNLMDGGEVRTADLVSQFHRLGDGFLMRLLMQIYTSLWMLLFIVPGIIKSYSYAMTTYILYENPGMRPNDAITASRRLMDGKKWRLFCLDMSFFGWGILCALPAFGVWGSYLLTLYFNPLILAGNPFAILWIVPVMLLTCVGVWILQPYQEAARAAFYRSICREAAGTISESGQEE